MHAKRPLFGRVLDGMVDKIENLHYFFSRFLKSNISDYIDLETILDDKYTLLARDSSLLTVIEFNGVKDMLNNRGLNQRLHDLEHSALGPLTQKVGHTFEIFFSFEPERGKELIKSLIQPSVRSAANLNLNLEDIFDSRTENLPKFIHEEHCYIGIWTHPDILGVSELEMARKNKMEVLENMKTYNQHVSDGVGQYIHGGLTELQDKHASEVKNILEAFNSEKLKFSARKMEAHDALRVVRNMLYRDETPADWKPVVTGDEIPTMQHHYAKKDNKGKKLEMDSDSLLLDKADFIYPSLAYQLMLGDMERINNRYLRVGNRIFAPCFIEIPQQYVTPFNDLFRNLKEANIPFFFKMNVLTGGMETLGTKKSLAGSTTMFSKTNMKIKEAYQRLELIAEKESMLRYTISICTYANVGEEHLLRSRHSQMMSLVAGWGNCQPKDKLGDPTIGVFDTVPFITSSRDARANPSVNCFFNVFKMMPIFRPCQTFESGASLFRSEDGKVMPFELCSPKQTTWAIYNVAKPGSGKSVLLAGMLLGAMTQPNLKGLPFISIMEIGPSSKAMVDMIRDLLPKEKKHLAISVQVTSNEAQSVNMFDLPLGCEKPDTIQFDTLNNFVCALLTPAGGNIDQDFPHLISLAIRRVYERFSRSRYGSPKKYAPNNNIDIDLMIKKHNIKVIPNETSWYDLAEVFFDMKEYVLANQAQSYAVPVLADLISVVQDDKIRDEYNFKSASTGQNIVDRFVMILRQEMENYPNLVRRTNIDFSNARIISADMDLVAKDSGDFARKKGAINMMAWKFLLTKNFRITPKLVVDEFPEKYHAYHLDRLQEIFSSNKFFVMDEAHRAKISPQLQNDIEVDVRESRKWKMCIILSSQQGEDISEMIRNQLSAIFILGANSTEEAKSLAKLFSFGEAEIENLLRYCQGPTSKGAPFLMILKTKEGQVNQLNYSTIAPTEAWGLSTTAEDVILRGKLYERLGPKEARARLGRAYSYTARDEINELNLQNSRLSNPILNFDAYQIIIDKLLASTPIYNNRIGAVTDAVAEINNIKDSIEKQKMKERLGAMYEHAAQEEDARRERENAKVAELLQTTEKTVQQKKIQQQNERAKMYESSLNDFKAELDNKYEQAFKMNVEQERLAMQQQAESQSAETTETNTNA